MTCGQEKAGLEVIDEAAHVGVWTIMIKDGEVHVHDQELVVEVVRIVEALAVTVAEVTMNEAGQRNVPIPVAVHHHLLDQ